MAITTTLPPAGARPASQPVAGPPAGRAAHRVAGSTVAVLAVLMSLADNFVLTSIQGAVGAIERAQKPFLFWLVTSALAVPVFVLAVLGALALARRLFGPVLHTPWRVVAAGLLIVVAGSAVGTAEMAVSAAYDYSQQSELAASAFMDHGAIVTPEQAAADPCTGSCAAQRDQYELDQRAAKLGSGLALGVNLVLVGWVVAMRGGRLERRRPRT
jgi:small-conductance mechanosensitive channel